MNADLVSKLRKNRNLVGLKGGGWRAGVVTVVCPLGAGGAGYLPGGQWGAPLGHAGGQGSAYRSLQGSDRHFNYH